MLKVQFTSRESNGEHVKLNQLTNGCPVWKKPGYERWIYRTTAGHWAIGSCLEFGVPEVVYHGAAAEGALPHELRGYWSVLDAQSQRFHEDSMIVVTAQSVQAVLPPTVGSSWLLGPFGTGHLGLGFGVAQGYAPMLAGPPPGGAAAVPSKAAPGGHFGPCVAGHGFGIAQATRVGEWRPGERPPR